ncbi:hypothetical protein [Komagataeibacter xylinus]|uniref:hypothetical protein n=1 Tax=Komagataeibacter xylinus TaxID=28448 RepID=UPI00280A740B|nr:hypothetical protein [Komagataeibacter xylinus]
MSNCFFRPLEKRDGTYKTKTSIIQSIRENIDSNIKFLIEYCFDHKGYVIVFDQEIDDETAFYLQLKEICEPMPNSRFIY